MSEEVAQALADEHAKRQAARTPSRAIVRRARWGWLSPTSKALYARSCDGGHILAVVQNVAFMQTQCPWRTVNGRAGVGYVPINAMQAARKALEGAANE